MSFSFVPPLQSMSATKIVTLLWNRADIIDLIPERNDIFITWQMIEERVNEKVLLLHQPAPLREKISRVVVSTGHQIKIWKRTHEIAYQIENIPRKFCWTSRGTLDKKGTAEVFVRDPTLPERERFRMACLYCLEWDNPIPFHETQFLTSSPFLASWIYDRMGDATALDSTLVRDTSKSPYERGFRCAVAWGNEVAVEYYFPKMTPEEREESLSDVESPYSLTNFGIFRFLLRHMSERQQSEFYKRHAKEVLVSLLAWPWQQFFMDGARRVRDTLKRGEYFLLLSRIADKMVEGYKDYNYEELFGSFWLQIPEDHKKEVMGDCDLLGQLFRDAGEKNISLMLKETSPEEKEEILFSAGGVHICSRLADHDKWDSLECFIGECITSRDKMIHLKEECEKRGNFRNTFFQFLDKLIQKCRENSVGEETDCPVPKSSLSGVLTDQV